jgi:hypothetical protein
MPGAGSIIGANYVYNIVNPMGWASGPSSHRSISTSTKTGRGKYDWAKFTWIGAPISRIICFICARIYLQKPGGRAAGKTAEMRLYWAGTSGNYMPKLLEETLGTKFTVIAGYQGGGEIDLAVERENFSAALSRFRPIIRAEPYHTWRKNGFARILIQTGKMQIAWLMFQRSMSL